MNRIQKINALLWGSAKKKTSKNPRLQSKWVGGSRSHSDFFGGKSSQNSPKPVGIFWSTMCILPVYDYALLKDVG